MEMSAEKKEMVELLLRPAIWVKDGIIRYQNAAAAHLLLAEGQPIAPLLLSGQEEYAQFSDGCLHLRLNISGQAIGATVIHQAEGHLFLPETQPSYTQFQNYSLTAMQLREPLAGLMAAHELILPGADPKYAAQANRRIHQLLRIISNMSDVRRYADPAACRPEYTEVCGFLEEILEKAEMLMEQAGIRLQRQIPRESIYTLLDREQLERSVYNLLSNAGKFGQPAEAVLVQLSRKGQKLHLSVVNSGVSPAASRFYQGFLREPALEDPTNGMGLGMLLVKSTAANHGGAVLIDHPGNQNTRITMTLAIRQGRGDTVRSPILGFDYAGDRDHGLLELVDVLPAGSYAIQK